MTFNPAERRDAHGRWTAGPKLAAVLKGHNVRGLATNPGTATAPINVHGDIMQGARLIAEGKHVRLNKVHDVGTLLTDLLRLSKEAKRKHETLDLCRVSIPKTNLFCAQSKGIPRINMPQLSGKPAPGSKGAVGLKPGDEIDLTNQFEKTLRAEGVKVTDTTMPAASLKATQNQLVGDKVAGIEKFMETAPKDSSIFEPIFVTRDHYIIDGHHRWAAMVGLDAKDGVLGNYPMKVRMIDMEIGEALAATDAFAKEWGLGHADATNDSPTASHFVSLSARPRRTIDLAFNPSEKRDAHGRWTSIGGLALNEIAKHLRGLPEGSTVSTEGLPSMTKTQDHTFAPFEPGPSMGSPELAAHINKMGVGSTKVPHGYDPRQDLLDAATLHDVPRMSNLASAHPDLLDDPLVRKTLSSTIGGKRLVDGHDYDKAKSAAQKSKSSAALDAVVAEHAAKAKRDQALEDLNNAVSDYEFATMLGMTAEATDHGDKIQQIMADNPGIEKTARGRALLKDIPEVSKVKPTYAEKADENQWATMDAQGSAGFEGTQGLSNSIKAEHQAQIDGEFWYRTTNNSSPEDQQYAASLWQQYQSPDLYGPINSTLRSGKAQEVNGETGPSPEDLKRYVDLMFKEGGTTIKHPMTVYRAIRSDLSKPGHNWSEVFKPGTTFNDKGIMSTTAHPAFAQGWLTLDPHGTLVNEEHPQDVVLEIRLPSGQRIVGGSTGFIEAMLPRDTTLKIISNERRHAEQPHNPLGGEAVDPFDYTHVVAEVVTK